MGSKIDLVTHDAGKFFELLLKKTAMCWNSCTRRWSSTKHPSIPS